MLISVFTVVMIVGTFVESLNGTEYANRLVYKSPFFILLQFGFFISISYAALLRLPAKKHLYGFYTIHAGLITIIIGSFVTYLAGIDGNVQLSPNTPSRSILLNEYVLTIESLSDRKRVVLQMPQSPFSTNVNETYKDIEVLEFLPFASERLAWQHSPYQSNTHRHSSSYFIESPMGMAQELTLSLHPLASDFDSSLKLGPLSVYYLPATLFRCFEKAKKSKLVVANYQNLSCETVSNKFPMLKTAKDERYFLYQSGTQQYQFYPDISPWPLDRNRNPIRTSPIRIFNQKLFEKQPVLFLFGEATAFFDDDQWVYRKLTAKQAINLPWMGFSLSLLKHKENEYPVKEPYYIKPINDGQKLLVGETKAVKIKVDDDIFWLKAHRPITKMTKNGQYRLYLGNRELKLPFELNLQRFKMDTDPGTNNPASYESFVDLFTKEGHSVEHIFMNNPLKYDRFTFYQASYFQDPQTGQFGSVLSVNFDPGRWLKYLGSILLVFGAAWHFIIRQKKTKKS